MSASATGGENRNGAGIGIGSGSGTGIGIDPGADAEATRAAALNALRAIAAGGGRAYLLLDAARDYAIHDRVEADPDGAWLCLYQGKAAEELADVAPYLAEIGRPASQPEQDSDSASDSDSDSASDSSRNGGPEAFAAGGWGKSWGIVLETGIEVGGEELRRHLRKFLMVRMPDGSRAHFRFYDPRVARKYLPTLNPAEAREFFGPIRTFWMEAPDAKSTLGFALDPAGAVLSIERPLAPGD